MTFHELMLKAHNPALFTFLQKSEIRNQQSLSWQALGGKITSLVHTQEMGTGYPLRRGRILLVQIAEQHSNTLAAFGVFQTDFDDNRQRNRQQHAHRAEQPAPENQRQKDHQRR